MPQALYTFKVDRSLFRLAVEAMRVYSLETESFETVSATALSGLEKFSTCENRTELVAMARKADIPGQARITFRIQMHQNELFQQARRLSGDSPDAPGSVRLTFIIGLFAAFHGTFTVRSQNAAPQPG